MATREQPVSNSGQAQSFVFLHEVCSPQLLQQKWWGSSVKKLELEGHVREAHTQADGLH